MNMKKDEEKAYSKGSHPPAFCSQDSNHQKPSGRFHKRHHVHPMSMMQLHATCPAPIPTTSKHKTTKNK
jgi:hypothetical protein